MSHRLSPLALSLALCCAFGTAQATNFPVTEAQKDTASRVAQACAAQRVGAQRP